MCVRIKSIDDIKVIDKSNAVTCYVVRLKCGNLIVSPYHPQFTWNFDVTQELDIDLDELIFNAKFDINNFGYCSVGDGFHVFNNKDDAYLWANSAVSFKDEVLNFDIGEAINDCDEFYGTYPRSVEIYEAIGYGISVSGIIKSDMLDGIEMYGSSYQALKLTKPLYSVDFDYSKHKEN